MPDLRERFASLSRARAPDLWPEIESREPEPVHFVPSPRRRLAAAGVALVVALAGSILAIRTFERVDEAPSGVSSGGGRIVFVGDAGDVGTDLYSMVPDGSDVRRLTRTAPSEEEPAWSPDATKIAFSLREQGEPASYAIGVMGVDGTDRAEVPGTRLENRNPVGSASWSPEGDEIAFAAYGEGGGIYVTLLGEGSSHRLTAAGPPTIHVDSDPVWSPDGSSIAFARWILGDLDTPGEHQIVMMDADGSDPRILARYPSDARSGTGDVEVGGLSWSPDGTRLAFTSLGNVYVLETVGGEPETVVACEALGCDDRTDVLTDSTSWSPDGSMIAFTAWLDVRTSRAEPPVIHVADLSTTPVTVLSTGVGGLSPTWSPVTTGDEHRGVVDPEVVETFEVGVDVRSVAFGEGSVWVAVSNDDRGYAGRIVRIDPETHQVQAEILVEAIPTWEVGGGAMVVADGSLWVAGSVEAPGAFDAPGGGADAAVVRIDASTNRVTGTFALGGTHGADLTFLDGDLWVLLFGDGTVDNAMEVVRVEPITGAVVTRVALPSNWAHTLVAADGRLVTAVGGKEAVNMDGRIVAVDPATGAISQSDVPSRFFTPMPVLLRGQVWVSTDPGFVRFDPVAEGFPAPPVRLAPRFGDCCGFLEADDRGIWFVSPDLAGGSGPHLNLFDPSTGEVTELVDLGAGDPVAMAVAPDSVWILNYEGTLTHVRLG